MTGLKYVFFIFIMIFTVYVVVVETQSFDSSSWSFTGYVLAQGFINNLALFIAVFGGIVLLYVLLERKND